MVAVKPTFRHDYFPIVYGQYCDTFQDFYEIFHLNHLFHVLTSIDLDERITLYISDGDSIGLFIEKYSADHSKVFLVCALKFEHFFQHFHLTIFLQINLTITVLISNLKSCLPLIKI